MAETTAAMMDDLKVRPALAEVIKQLIAAGNVVAYLPQDRAPRVYRIDQFVLKRDNYGQFTDIIIQEKVWPSTLPEAVRTALGVKLDPNTDEKQIDVYTVVEQRDSDPRRAQSIKDTVSRYRRLATAAIKRGDYPDMDPMLDRTGTAQAQDMGEKKGWEPYRIENKARSYGVSDDALANIMSFGAD